MAAGATPLPAISPEGRTWPSGLFSITENPQAVAAASVAVKAADPDCVGLIFQNLGANPVTVTTNVTATLTTGFLLPVNSVPLVITGPQFFSMMQQAWAAISNAGGTTLQVCAIKRTG